MAGAAAPPAEVGPPGPAAAAVQACQAGCGVAATSWSTTMRHTDQPCSTLMSWPPAAGSRSTLTMLRQCDRVVPSPMLSPSPARLPLLALLLSRLELLLPLALSLRGVLGSGLPGRLLLLLLLWRRLDLLLLSCVPGSSSCGPIPATTAAPAAKVLRSQTPSSHEHVR